MNWISIYESLLIHNKVEPFLKRKVTGDENWVAYDNVNKKWSRSKHGKKAQTVIQPGLKDRKIFLCF